MRRGPEEGFDPVREPCSHDDQEPRVAHADQARGKVTEPDSGHGIRREMGSIQVQGQGGPHAPPLPLLYQSCVELSYIEGIEAPQTIGDCKGNTYEDQRVHETTQPRVRMKLRWWG